MSYYTLEITDDMSELEKFVRQEAMNYVNATCFLSSISDEHPNIDSVIEKGKDITPYVVKLYKEKGEYASDNMFTHFFSSDQIRPSAPRAHSQQKRVAMETAELRATIWPARTPSPPMETAVE